MTAALHLAPQHRSVLFGDDEPVLQSHPLLPGAVVPTFGTTDAWSFKGVVRLAVNRNAANSRTNFKALDPVWNLRAREVGMIWFNPRHKAVLARGVHLTHQPRKPDTVQRRVGMLRSLSTWSKARLPPDLADWSSQDMVDYIESLKQRLAIESITEHVLLIKTLHLLAPILTDGGLAADPWPGVAAHRVIDRPRPEGLKTEAVSPQAWFPLMRAAWTYIEVFSPDILRAVRTLHDIKAAARPLPLNEARERAAAWLADPANLVPVRHKLWPGETAVNFMLLTLLVGVDHARVRNLFSPRVSPSRALRELAVEIAQTRSQPGVVADLAEVERPDGTRGPWHLGLNPRELWLETLALRNACYVFTVGLSMMRDSEIREITKGSVVEHYGSPAVKSTKIKLDADLPTKHWWIIEPVAKAIDVASQLSLDDELTFGAVHPGRRGALFDSAGAIEDFIARVNATRDFSGLPEIPVEHITPHQFRVTMAMLTRDQPGSEIAIGMQLKHVATRALANRVSQSYAAPSQKWLGHLDNAVEQARFQRLRDLFEAHRRGEPVGYGPGADRMRATFEAVEAKAAELRATGQARHGDRRVEHDLLRSARFTIRFGKLNHCTMDDANPAGAKCLENAIAPTGHTGPLADRCQPGRCGNSIIGPEHVPIWTAERGSLLQLLETPGLPPGRRAALDAQLAEVDLTLRRTQP